MLKNNSSKINNSSKKRCSASCCCGKSGFPNLLLIRLYEASEDIKANQSGLIFSVHAGYAFEFPALSLLLSSRFSELAQQLRARWR